MHANVPFTLLVHPSCEDEGPLRSKLHAVQNTLRQKGSCYLRMSTGGFPPVTSEPDAHGKHYFVAGVQVQWLIHPSQASRATLINSKLMVLPAMYLCHLRNSTAACSALHCGPDAHGKHLQLSPVGTAF
jgi:hypothetical protein